MLNLIHVGEALRLLRRTIQVRKRGVHKYQGNAKKICQQIVKDCWNGSFFQTSAGHYNQFWNRDFGWCIESLMKLGYQKEVKKTLMYAMEKFKQHNKITTTISPEGIPYDFPIYGVDTIPYFIRSLSIGKCKGLIKENKDFLNKEIKKFFGKCINKRKGIIKKRHFSSMKDHAIRHSSCYDNVMAAMLNEELKRIKILKNPLIKYDLKKRIKYLFWKKRYFIDDISGSEMVTGDANVFPFWTGVFTSKEMLKSAISTIQEHNLDKPFPLRYYHKKAVKHKMILLEILAYGYERDTVWMHMGPLYIKIIRKIDKGLASKYIKMYTKVIEKNKNYLELFFADGKPFKRTLYHADEGMLWASIYLDLVS